MAKKKSLLREVLTTPKYDVEEFLIPVSDSKGHSVAVGLRCQSRYIRVINEIMAGRKFPYRTVSDLLRHAIHRQLHWLHEIEPEIPTSIAYLEAATGLAKTQQMMMEFLNTIQVLEATVSQLTACGMKEEAKRMIQEILDKMEADPIDDAWRKKFTEELKSRFAHLLPRLKK